MDAAGGDSFAKPDDAHEGAGPMQPNKMTVRRNERRQKTVVSGQ
ncbi:MAG: hypothetical protein U9M96_02155 [Thermodesulfobacteriota bacterium]|nr:hypothetical protein [Thermodesulfobacteriota bacterium]